MLSRSAPCPYPQYGVPIDANPPPVVRKCTSPVRPLQRSFAWKTASSSAARGCQLLMALHSRMYTIPHVGRRTETAPSGGLHDHVRTIYCRRCSYRLTGLPEPRCPECGTGFDPTRRRTYRTRPRNDGTQRAAWAAGTLLLIFVAAMSPRVLRAYYKLQQQRYAEACTEIAAAGGHVWAKDSANSADTPEQLDHVSLTDGLPVLEAADVARAKVYMARFPPFRLDLGQRELGPGAFAEFSGLRNVRALSASNLRDADLQWMIKLPGLEWLGITGRQITDQGIAGLRLPPHVRGVVLARTSVTPRAIASLEAAYPNGIVFVPTLDDELERQPPPFKTEEESQDGGAPGAKFESWVVHVDSNGKAIWQSPRFPGEWETSPVWDQRRVYQPLLDGLAAFDATTGKLLWKSPGPSGATFRAGEDLLLTFRQRGADPKSHRPFGAEMVARSALSGRTLFDLALPSSEDWAYSAGYPTEPAYRGEPGPIDAGDVILCRASSGPKRTDVTLALDHSGRERFRIDGPVVSAVTEGDGWVFLMPDSVRRVRSDGSIAWSVPTKWGGTRGQLLRCPEGDVISLTYSASGDAYQLARVNCSAGALVWRHTSPVRLGNHFIYTLEARMELRRGLLAVTEDGTGGMWITVFDPRTGEARFDLGVPQDPAPRASK